MDFGQSAHESAYLPTSSISGSCEPALQGVPFTIYMPPQLAQYSYLPTYLP